MLAVARVQGARVHHSFCVLILKAACGKSRGVGVPAALHRFPAATPPTPTPPLTTTTWGVLVALSAL